MPTKTSPGDDFAQRSSEVGNAAVSTDPFLSEDSTPPPSSHGREAAQSLNACNAPAKAVGGFDFANDPLSEGEPAAVPSGDTLEDIALVEEAKREDTLTYPVVTRRFVVVGVFALFGFINQVQYVAYATIVREAQEKFGISALEVNVLSLLIPVVYCLGVVPGCWLYNKVGLRYGMIVGGGANALASVLKMITVWAPYYPIAVIAQVFVAIGQILYLSLPPLIAARWFPVAERTVATAVCSLAGFAGMAVGMFAPPRVVHLPNDVGTREWGGLMGTQLALSVVVVALMVFLVPEKPKHQPSLTAAKEAPDGKIWKSLRRPFCNMNMMILTTCFGLSVGFLTAVAAVLTQIVEPFGITESHAGILAFSGILGGAANCAFVGFIVDRIRRYKVPSLILEGTMVVLLIVVAVLIKPLRDNKEPLVVVVYVVVPLLEFLALPLVPVTMELAVELTYPHSETVAATVVLLSMCFFSFIGMIIFTIILGDEPTMDDSFIVVIIVAGICAASFIGLCFVKEERHRYRQEHVLQTPQQTVTEGESASGVLNPSEDALQPVYETPASMEICETLTEPKKGLKECGPHESDEKPRHRL